MNELISRIVSIPPPFNMVVIVVGLLVGAGVITTLASELRKYVLGREELELKRELIERGMSVDEVERVVSARSKTAG